jgi:hypothetical protein
MTMMKTKQGGSQPAQMSRGEVRAAIDFAHSALSVAQNGFFAYSMLVNSYEAALASARAVCGRANYLERDDLETLLEAALILDLGEEWVAEARLQVTAHRLLRERSYHSRQTITEEGAIQAGDWAMPLVALAYNRVGEKKEITIDDLRKRLLDAGYSEQQIEDLRTGRVPEGTAIVPDRRADSMTTTMKKKPGTAGIDSDSQCAYADCRAPLPGPYGMPGVSLSRADGETLICSRCGTREALELALLGTHFRGLGRAR